LILKQILITDLFVISAEYLKLTPLITKMSVMLQLQLNVTEIWQYIVNCGYNTPVASNNDVFPPPIN
jgi:hypothetical protein